MSLSQPSHTIVVEPIRAATTAPKPPSGEGEKPPAVASPPAEAIARP